MQSQQSEPEDERRWLSYEGTTVPMYMVLVWLAFLGFGFLYFARYLLS